MCHFLTFSNVVQNSEFCFCFGQVLLVGLQRKKTKKKVSVYLTGLSLVVGLVLYISNINDELLNRTKSNEAYFSYNYGWSFAFAAISFLLTEVTPARSLFFFFFFLFFITTTGCTPETSQHFSPSHSKLTLAPNSSHI